MSKPRVLSLFSGVGGFDLGLERAGFEVIGQVEIDPFCNRVLGHHWPEVPRYGDVSNFDGDAITNRKRPDVIAGGFPCQDLSVAGKRAGLDGERSGLWFEFKRILSELRPTYALIENVPGLLSSNQGRDFAIVLDGLVECGFGGIGWRILDSQFFGVAQRRRRVFIVAGPTRAGVEQILSLCESCGGDSEAGGETGEDVARPLGASTSSFGGQRYDLDNETYVPDLSPTVTAKWGKGSVGRAGDEVQNLVGALTASMGEQGVPGNTQVDANQLVPLAGLLTTEMYHHGGIGNQSADTDGLLLPASASVRRLTPVECERLQGFPDGWTDVGNAADGPRYRALGNAVTVPVIEYLGMRLIAQLANEMQEEA